MDSKTLSPELLHKIDAYWRAEAPRASQSPPRRDRAIDVSRGIART